MSWLKRVTATKFVLYKMHDLMSGIMKQVIRSISQLLESDITGRYAENMTQEPSYQWWCGGTPMIQRRRTECIVK